MFSFALFYKATFCIVAPGQMLWMLISGDKKTPGRSVAFVLAFASSAQALPPMQLQQPGSVVITVREACGAGMHRINGVCVPLTRDVPLAGARSG
jgi:hypothetical protein